MVVSHNDLLDTYSIYQDVPDILRRTKIGEIPGKRCDNEVVYTQCRKYFCFLFDSVDHLQVLVLRINDHSRVREEGEDHTFSARSVRELTKSVDDLLMAKMYAVKSTYSGYGIIQPFKFGQVVIYFQNL